jgi:hypothetical protein
MACSTGVAETARVASDGREVVVSLRREPDGLLDNPLVQELPRCVSAAGNQYFSQRREFACPSACRPPPACQHAGPPHAHESAAEFVTRSACRTTHKAAARSAPCRSMGIQLVQAASVMGRHSNPETVTIGH